ncbi:hypothetical protein MUO83_08805 [Candidatus Bathyarchaeota archaeon]|nr:hypothetical protein [Candidatus Bathyarchaeota archaeon]
MNLTVELLRVLGSPFEPTTFSTDQDKLVELSRISAGNRMLFFYLHKIGPKNLGELVGLYKNEQTSYIRTNDAIARASKILTDANIEHAFFKTIRPYTSTTVDLDILIFGGDGDHIKSVKVMKNAGYKLVTHGPRSTTLLDKEANVGIDLYSEVAVSFITYMDKTTLSPCVATTKLPNGEHVKILQPEADLSCIIAHSIIKEQMYTLSEYYTFIHYLKQMNINNFLQIVKQNNITSAARTHASITALLHKAAYRTMPEELQRIVESLGEENLETTRLIRNDFETPHKYHPITVAKSLLEITKGRKSRNSMVMQIYHMLNPNFTKKFLKDLLQHIKRETY